MPDPFQRVGPESRSAIRCRLITLVSPTVVFPALALFISDKVKKDCQDMEYLLNIGGSMMLFLLVLFYAVACWTSCFVTSIRPCCSYCLICCVASLLFYILALLLVSRKDVFGDNCWRNPEGPEEGYGWEETFTKVFWYFCVGFICLFFNLLFLYSCYRFLIRTCYKRENFYSAHYPSVLSSRRITPVALHAYEPQNEVVPSWPCPRCSFDNDGRVWICQMCDHKKGTPVIPVPDSQPRDSVRNEPPNNNSNIFTTQPPIPKRRKRPPKPPVRKNQIRKSSASSIDENKECKICFDTTIDCVLLPCGHMCACYGCAEQLKNCPICRGRITQVQRVFSS